PTRAGLAIDRLARNGAERLLRQRQIDALHLEQPLVLLYQRVLRLGENALQRRLVEVFERGDDRQAADEFGDQAVAQQIIRLDLAENLALLAILRCDHLGAKADGGGFAARRNDLVEPGERTAAHEQDVGRVDLQ